MAWKFPIFFDCYYGKTVFTTVQSRKQGPKVFFKVNYFFIQRSERYINRLAFFIIKFHEFMGKSTSAGNLITAEKKQNDGLHQSMP